MKSRTRWIVVGIGVAAFAVTGAGVAIANSSNDGPALSGSTLDQASKAALAYTGGGTVTEAEAGDQGAAYDVEVQKADGTTVDLRLDSSFHVYTEEHDGGSQADAGG